MYKYTKIIITLGIFFASPACAAPNNISVPASLIDKQEVTITGLDFGNKATQNPTIWDDFEDGTDSAIVPGTYPIFGGAWARGHGGTQDVVYSNESLRPGSTMSILSEDRATGNCNLGWVDESNEYYLSFWAQFNSNDELIFGHRQWKPYYIFPNPSSGTIIPRQALGLHASSSWRVGHDIAENTLGDTVWIPCTDVLNDMEGRWFRMELYARQSSIPNAADGEITVNLFYNDAVYTGSKTSLVTRAGDVKYGYVNIIDWYGDEPNLTGSIYLDDVYFDTTRARVEIGNAASWENCTKREIQIPTSWSNDSATITVNKGSFTDGPAFLFVVDSNGEASAGYPITIGDSSDITPPSAPNGLSIS